MNNEVHFDDAEGVIYLLFHGDQTFETVSALWPEIESSAKKLRDSGRPVLVLGDTRDMRHQDSGSRKAGLEVMKRIGLTRYALIVTSRFLRMVSEFIIRASGFAGRVKNFSSPDEAISWLKEAKKK